MNPKTIAKIISVAAAVINKTLRKEILNDDHYYPQQAIYPFWHGAEFMMLMTNTGSNIVIMASKSKDGEIMAALLEKFGYIAVRGSSSRGGEKGLMDMLRLAKEGRSLAFAADGPRGPYHELKAGTVYAAQKTGLPVLPVSSIPKTRYIFKKSWDKMRMPLPFSRTVQVYGAPIYVKPEDDIETKRIEIQNSLNKIFEFTDKIYWGKDIKEYLEYHPCPKILIVQPSRLGDIVFSLPTLAALRKKYPHARISWLVDERCAEILEGNLYLENIFIWDRRKKTPGYYLKLRKQLRKNRFDLSIDLHGLSKSALLVKLAGAKFKLASSSTNGMREFSWLFSKEIKPANLPLAHCVERHMAVAEYLDCGDEINYPIAVSEENFKSVKTKLENEKVDIKKMIGIHPGGGWTSRRWSTDKFAVLSAQLKDNLGADIVLVGGKEGGASEKGLNEEIMEGAGVKIFDMTGKFTLKELCAFLKMCRVFVGNEAGPMHIATALGVRSVALLGPTDAKRTGPYAGNTQVIQHKFPCQPCRNRKCKNPLCMKAISVEEVFEAVKKKYENTDN